MRIAVLRVSGAFEVETYLARFGMAADRFWRAGQFRRPGEVHSDSGFSITIADASLSIALMDQIRRWCDEHGAALDGLTELFLHAELDVGLTVGASDQYTASIVFNPRDLAPLAKYGIVLRVSAYPSSEADELT